MRTVGQEPSKLSSSFFEMELLSLNLFTEVFSFSKLSFGSLSSISMRSTSRPRYLQTLEGGVTFVKDIHKPRYLSNLIQYFELSVPLL